MIVKTMQLTGLFLYFAFAAACFADSGPEIWANQCAKCHGADGGAQTPMGKKLQIKMFTDAKVQAELTDDGMLKAIKQGKKAGDGKTLMPPAENVTEDDIKALIQVVRSFKK
jgi:mono/diheme cytochrome c family protein